MNSQMTIAASEMRDLIEEFAGLSETSEGVTRLGYTPLERQAHAVFAEKMRTLGLHVHVDQAGNSIAELEGDGGGPAIGTGSHLDSVPNGGRFDGIAGVCAGMAVARAMVESGQRPRRRWRFVAFATEEGARFGQACNGSKAIAGLTSTDDLRRLQDSDGISMFEAMDAVDLHPGDIKGAVWQPADWQGFVELHIEQGTVLEAAEATIGIVDSISGSTRLEIRLIGVASHTGGTPMFQRHDALVAAAECVLLGERLAVDAEHHGTRITVGRLQVEPGSITTIPGEVTFSVDVRDFDSARQRDAARRLDDEFALVASSRGIEYDCVVIGDTSPVVLPLAVIDTIARATKGRALPYRVMSSGASHDSQQVSKVTPTGMIFVPSVKGLSHVPEELTDYEDLARGTEVLLDAMLLLDAGQTGDATGPNS